MTTEARNGGSNGASAPVTPPRVLAKLRDEIGTQLMSEFGYTSPMQVPRFTKIVLNIGMGEALQNARAMESATRDLTLISGQRPVTTRARKSVAGFKIREGMPIGLSVTLRGRRMYEFYDRLVSSALPRIRDFQGVSREAFDGRGNFSLGIREQVIFPEIEYNSIDRIRGLQVVIVTTARTDREGLRLRPIPTPWPGRKVSAFGEGIQGSEMEETSAVQGEVQEPLQQVWQATGLHTPLRPVPHLFQGNGPERPAPGRAQGQLVARESDTGREEQASQPGRLRPSPRL